MIAERKHRLSRPLLGMLALVWCGLLAAAAILSAPGPALRESLVPLGLLGGAFLMVALGLAARRP
jgi:hypothetical protein